MTRKSRIVSLAHARCLVAAAVLAACSGASTDDGIGPVMKSPPPRQPAIVLSSDSVVSSLLAGAAAASQEIDVTAGNASAVSGLAVLDSGAVAGQSTWLTATLSSTTAPAKLTVRLSPTSVPAGRYE